MAGITLAQAEAKLTEYLAAESQVLLNQNYTMDFGGSRRTLTRADLEGIQAGIKIWENRVARLSRKGLMVREVIPR